MEFDQIGKYKIVGKIGQGAMGEVFKAQDLVLSRFVALKTISPNLVSDEQFHRRFEREAQSAAQLNHPNIVTVFEFSEDKGIVYLVMELLGGKDLKELIARRAVYHLEEKLHIAEQICDGLAFAHAKGVIHRDLKPANIHVLPNMTVKIMDFGLARLGVSEMTRTGTVMGTPNYMSPEQVRGDKVDARSDLFSVGAVFYELLSGHKPFDSASVHSILYEVLSNDPHPLSAFAPNLPPLILLIVDRALAKDPARRFQSAAEMRDALRAARRAVSAARAASALLAPGVDSDSTLVGADVQTIAQMGPPSSPSLSSIEHKPLIAGATALDLRTLTSVRSASETARPEPTLTGARLHPPVAPTARRWTVPVLSAAVLAVAAMGSAYWLLQRRTVTPTMAPGEIVREQEGILKEVLISSQVELARANLEDKDYREAAAQAERVVQLAPDNAEARQILSQAQGELTALDNAAREARASFQAGDANGASRALGRVMAIDPRHPVAVELSAALNQHFRAAAEDGRRAAEQSRLEAERARAGSLELYRTAQKTAREAEALLRRDQFAQATQKFLEAKDGYGRARRAAEVTMTTLPSPPPRVAAASTAPVTPPAPASVRPPQNAPPASVSAPPAATSAPVPTLAASPLSQSLPAPPNHAPAVLRVITDYGRALETRDVTLFKTLKPDLSGDEEKRLREAFKAIQSQRVSITIESVQIEGSRATVRVSRQDTLNGKSMRPLQQTFRLVEKDGTWTIQSIGQ
jgi:serine/threonine protein kinase/tetratricopeptide (TPR) repeat protein